MYTMNLRPSKKIKFTTTEEPWMCRDRFAEIPDDVIHRILSFLPTKTIIDLRTLSKRWSSVGAAYTNFTEPPVPKQRFLSCRHRQELLQAHRDRFLIFVDSSLQRLQASKTFLQRFALCVNLVDIRHASRIDDCIELVTKSNVKELDLYIKSKRGSLYTVPQKIYGAKTLSILKLRHCKLEPPSHGDTVKFNSLKQLCFNEVKLQEGIIQAIISSNSMIEQLKLVMCSGIGCLLLSDLPHLRKVKISQCNELPIPTLKIDVPGVRELIFHESRQRCKLDIRGCTGLTHLSLRDAFPIDDLFGNPFTLFTDLETLDLRGRNLLLDRVDICGHQLRKIISTDLHNDSIIDAPNLCCFRYYCYEDSMSAIFAIRTPGLKTSLLMLEIFVRKLMTTLWFLKFRESIQHFKKNNRLTLKLKLHPFLASFYQKELQHMSIPPMQPLEHLEITLTDVTSRKCFDGLLWSCHPETLAIVTHWKHNITPLKYLLEALKETEGKLNCCTDLRSSSKCWRHSLKGYQVKMKISGMGKHQNQGIMDLEQNLPPYSKIVFHLKWVIS